MANRSKASSFRLRSRRQAILGAAAAIVGAAASGSLVWAQAMRTIPSRPEDRTRTSLYQEVRLGATPHRVYEMLVNSANFAAFTHMPARIDARPGGAISLFDGLIVGHNIVLVSDRRVVQAWRAKDWGPNAADSTVRFDLGASGNDTVVALHHFGFPQGEYDHLYEGWGTHYWEPLNVFFAHR